MEITTFNVERVLREFADEYVQRLKDRLIADGRKASGKLLDSIRASIVSSGTNLKVVLESEDYLKYVDYGRNSGKMPPKEAIENWIREKGIKPEPDKNGKLPTEKQLVYLIQRSIGELGTLKDYGYHGHGGWYTDKVLEELYPLYSERLQEALYMDFDITAKAMLDEIKKIIKI